MTWPEFTPEQERAQLAAERSLSLHANMSPQNLHAYERWHERMATKLARIKIPYPCQGCCDGTYLGHFLKYSRRY